MVSPPYLGRLPLRPPFRGCPRQRPVNEILTTLELNRIPCTPFRDRKPKRVTVNRNTPTLPDEYVIRVFLSASPHLF